MNITIYPANSSEKESKNVTNDFDFFDEKGKFLHNDFAEYIIDDYNICKIDEVLHVYNENHYVNNFVEIEKIIVQLISKLKKNQRAEVLDYIRITAEERTRNKDYISCLNGLYNIKDHKLYKHNPDIITTNLNPVIVDKTAYSKEMDEALDSWCNNDKELRLLLEEMIGYCFLSDNRFHKTFILYGDGSNGKSTFLKVLEALIGKQNYSNVPLQDLDKEYMMAQLYNKQVNLGDDIPNTSIKDTSHLKKLTSGEMMMARHLYGSPFQFQPYCKLIFTSNPMVRFNDQSHGLYRRICYIPFNNSFSKDSEEYEAIFEEKLLSEEALSYLFRVAMQGLKRLTWNDGFTEPKVVKELELKFLHFNNHSVVEFVEDNDVEGKTVDNAYAHYTNWCLMTRKKLESKDSFGKTLSKMGYASQSTSVKGKRVRVYKKTIK